MEQETERTQTEFMKDICSRIDASRKKTLAKEIDTFFERNKRLWRFDCNGKVYREECIPSEWIKELESVKPIFLDLFQPAIINGVQKLYTFLCPNGKIDRYVENTIGLFDWIGTAEYNLQLADAIASHFEISHDKILDDGLRRAYSKSMEDSLMEDLPFVYAYNAANIAHGIGDSFLGRSAAFRIIECFASTWRRPRLYTSKDFGFHCDLAVKAGMGSVTYADVREKVEAFRIAYSGSISSEQIKYFDYTLRYLDEKILLSKLSIDDALRYFDEKIADKKK